MLNRSQKGITLLELMLVLAIASTIIIVGLTQYYHFKLDRDAEQLKSTVNKLFEALKGYYYANCRGQYNSGTNSYNGSLNPTKSPPSPYPLDISTDLNAAGFLTTWPLPFSSFVDDSVTSDISYIVQFNKSTSTRQTFACTNPQAGAVTCSATTPTNGTVIIWRLQVALKVKDNATALQYQGLLGADCVSNLNTNSAGKNIVDPCSPAPVAGGDYLVWERLPSFAVGNPASNIWNPTSSLWISMPRVNQFTQQYTNDDNYSLIGKDDSYNTSTGYLNYLCGG